MQDKIKKDLAIMRVLKTKELRYSIGMTAERGAISLVVTKEDPAYRFYVDAIPLEDEENDAMLKIYNLK